MPLSCPRDGEALTVGREHGIEIDRCQRCGGAWYEGDELEALESTIANHEDHLAGTVEYAKCQSELDCPECGKRMRSFNYRAYNLELDACEDEHGFWLDAGESVRVREVMQERVRGMRRAHSAQKSWHRAKRGGSGGVLDQLRDLFRR